MEHYRSQLDFPEGSIEIQFNLEFDGTTLMVQNIQVHTNADFKAGLPHSPTLEWHDSKWKLAAHYQVEEKGRIVNRTEYLDTKWSNAVVTEIIRIKEKETPRFVP